MALPNVPLSFWFRSDVYTLTSKIDAGSAPAKITYQHVHDSKVLRAIAIAYVDSYAGNWDFMCSLQTTQNSGRSLTDSQLAAALNTLVRDYKREKPAIVEAMIDKTHVAPTAVAPYIQPVSITPHVKVDAPTVKPVVFAPVIKDGTYTIVLNEVGDYRTLRVVDAQGKMNRVTGTQVVSYLSGADNETSYTGFAFLEGNTIIVWSKFKADTMLVKALQTLVNADSEQQIDYGAAYAMESGKCWHCGRKLTVPASLHRGVGPVCAEKLGILAPLNAADQKRAKVMSDVNELWPD